MENYNFEVIAKTIEVWGKDVYDVFCEYKKIGATEFQKLDKEDKDLYTKIYQFMVDYEFHLQEERAPSKQDVILDMQKLGACSKMIEYYKKNSMWKIWKYNSELAKKQIVTNFNDTHGASSTTEELRKKYKGNRDFSQFGNKEAK